MILQRFIKIGLMAVLVLLNVWMPMSAYAQSVHQELDETVRARVTRVLEERTVTLAETNIPTTLQTVEARLLTGSREGEIVQFENDFAPLEVDDAIYLNLLTTFEGDEYITMQDFDRRGILLLLGVGFVVLFVGLAGRKGVRALFSLGLSISALFFVLVPLILAGYSPLLVTIGVAGLVLAAAIFITHGRSAPALIAFCGTFIAVVVTSFIAFIVVHAAHFNGFGNDAAVYLNVSTQGSIDLVALLLAGIIIGMLGVLDDVAVTQAAVAEELKHANPRYRFRDLYRRALRVGRDHMASLVNTLAFAYVGVSLPLILLLAKTDSSRTMLLNQELVADELIRIMLGSIGVILAVPLTTAIAAWWYDTRQPKGEVYGHHH